MAGHRTIVILDERRSADGSFYVKAALWLVVPANMVKPNPNYNSQVPPQSATVQWGITNTEVTDIQSGQYLEKIVSTGLFPAGTLAAGVEAELQNMFQLEQDNLNAQAPSLKLIGGSYNGTAWSLP